MLLRFYTYPLVLDSRLTLRNTISPHLVGVPTAPKGEMAPLWKPPSSLIAKKHTVTGQVKPIGQRGRPALLTGVIIHDASTLLLVLAGYSISRYKEPNKKSWLSKLCQTSREIPAQQHAGMTGVTTRGHDFKF